MQTYKVMCEYGIQCSIAYVQAESAAAAVRTCMGYPGVLRAYLFA